MIDQRRRVALRFLRYYLWLAFSKGCRVAYVHTQCAFPPQGYIMLQPGLFGSSLGWICRGDAFIILAK